MNDLGVSLHAHNYVRTFREAVSLRSEPPEFDRAYLKPGFSPSHRYSPIFGIERTTPRLATALVGLLTDCAPYAGTLDQYAHHAKRALLAHLVHYWDASRPTLFLHSNGYDSRILSSCLAELRDGGFNLGRVHFRCHEPEGDQFKRIMERQGWPRDTYSVFEFPAEDLFDVGHWDEPGTSPWLPLTTFANFWSDIVPRGEEKNWNLLSGQAGGEAFEYPTLQKPPFVPYQFCENKPVQLWWSYFIDGTDWIGDMEARFGKVLMPYLGTRHILTVSMLHPDFLGYEDNGCDRVRASILRTFKDSTLDLPRVLRTYEWRVSEKRWSEMRDRYAASKFLRDVPGAPSADELIARMRATWFSQTDNTAERLWRFASLWEVIA